MATSIEVRVPDIGDFKDIAVIELLVKPGDRIKPGQAVVTLESDKSTLESDDAAEYPGSRGDVATGFQTHLFVASALTTSKAV
jgi:hypothetical protein